MIEPIIEVKNIRVIYNEGKINAYEALRGESLEIYPNEYIVLFGPSGCGKSTLLYAFLGVLAPTYGELIVKGENPYKYNIKQMVHFQRKTMGIIYQSFNIIPSITVLDNVALPLIFAGIPKAERERQGMELLKRFGIDKQAHKLPTNLSGGQMQRVAVARSLVNDPEILLADEPVGNLDSISSEEVMGTLDEINSKDKKTVILVTHDAKFLPYAHRVYFMKDGGVEREVINPEKKQIKQVAPGTSVLSEIEKLARIYPYASPEELRVKSVVNFLTQGMGFEQLENLEKIVRQYIEGRFEDKTFKNRLMGGLDAKGVELSAFDADMYSAKIQIMLKEGREIRNYRDNFSARVLSGRQPERIASIREDIINRCGAALDVLQREKLDTLVKYRIRGFIQSEDFRHRLEDTQSPDGLGIEEGIAREMSRYMEKILAQGLYL
ncbi:MAG: ABC transporter ATP-binding protein [bacterium]|nr:ABC transporter ATP-binding protein [bacterium]